MLEYGWILSDTAKWLISWFFVKNLFDPSPSPKNGKFLLGLISKSSIMQDGGLLT